MTDADLDRDIRDYFAARLDRHTPPEFESTLARATMRRPRRVPWLVPVLAASVLIVAALLRSDRHAGDPKATAELVAELSSSTHWTAPSDRWLGRQVVARVHTLPNLDRMTEPLEENPWL